MEQKTCFVSMPFGKKPDLQTGRELDFDRVYREIVRPAAEETGYRALRAAELGTGIIARPLFEQLLSSDVFIADVTTANPNVMYELGLRHALSNAVTLLVAEADWAHRLPFDLGYARVIVYRAQPGGQLEPKKQLGLAVCYRRRYGKASDVRAAIVRFTRFSKPCVLRNSPV